MNQLLLLAALAFAQEMGTGEALVAPPVESDAPNLDDEAAAPAAEERKPAAANEPAAAPESPKPQPAAPVDELVFLKAAIEDSDAAVRAAALAELRAYNAKQPTPDGVALAAKALTQNGDAAAAVVEWLRLFHEFPESKEARSRAAFNELVERKFGRKLKPAMTALLEVRGDDGAQRLSNLVWAMAGSAAEHLYAPAVELARRLPPSDKTQWALAQLHAKQEKAAEALLAYRKLLAMHPNTALRADAQLAVAGIYAEQLRDWRRAVKAYLELGDHPLALQRAALIYTDKLKQYDAAVGLYERLIKLDERKPEPYMALALIQQKSMGLPEEAIKTYRRLGSPEALRKAADVARRDLKNYGLEVELRKAAGDAEDFYAAAEVEESDLKDLDKAIETYREISSKFSGHKLAKKAGDRAAKLESKKSQ